MSRRLACHTGLHDWRRAAAAGQAVPWDGEARRLWQAVHRLRRWDDDVGDGGSGPPG